MSNMLYVLSTYRLQRENQVLKIPPSERASRVRNFEGGIREPAKMTGWQRERVTSLHGDRARTPDSMIVRFSIGSDERARPRAPEREKNEEESTFLPSSITVRRYFRARALRLSSTSIHGPVQKGGVSLSLSLSLSLLTFKKVRKRERERERKGKARVPLARKSGKRLERLTTSP